MTAPVSTLAEFRDAHRGETIVVCGCGESLTLLQRPERFVTIGVNDVGRHFTPDYLVVVNPRSQFAGDRFRYVETSRAKALFTQLDLGVPHPRVVRFRLGRYGGTDSADPNVLHYTRNSPYVAICLAIRMGARRIGLLGVDFTEHHFFGRTGVHHLAGRLSQIDAEYGRLAEHCRARGIELVNVSPTSRLTALPRSTLDALAPRAPDPAVAVPPVPVPPRRRVFFVNYRFLACGDVFATGLAHAAAALGVDHDAAGWDDPALPAKIRAFAPDLVFVVHGRRAAQRWARLWREWKTAVWLLDEPYEIDDTSRWSSTFGTVFVNDASTLARHRNAHLLPVCFDPQVHRDAGLAREHQVGFIGGYNPVRERYLLRLAEEGVLSYGVGGPWNAAALRSLQLAERSTPAETAQLYQRTRIVVNVFRSVHHFNRDGVPATALNPRIFEALACGALVVSEPRPDLAAAVPEVPTFRGEADLVATVRGLLDDPARAATLLAASRGRLAGGDYAGRLATALAIALGEPVRSGMAETAVPAPAEEIRVSPTPVETASLPAGWEPVGCGVAGEATGILTLTADPASEAGMATSREHRAVKLAFDVRLDARCQFIAKIHHVTRGDRGANSYHLLATPERAYVARHHVVLAPVTMGRGAWQHVEITWNAGMLTVAIDGREACRCADTALEGGYCFVGVSGGAADVRGLFVETPPAERSLIDGWSIQGGGTLVPGADQFVLSAPPGHEVSLVSETPFNDVELAFALRLDAGAHFISKVHHQSREDAGANSYHLVSTPASGYVARHDQVLADVRLARRAWQHVRLRWVDQRLELFVNDRRRAEVADNLLQSGYCVLGVTGGRAEVRGLTLRDVSASNGSAGIAPDPRSPRPGRDTLPFTAMPRRNLIYHVWPVRGAMWRWNVEQLLARIDLFNGRRIVGIVHDARSEDPDDVRRMFDGHGCDFIVAPNAPTGEGLTFPSMLARVRSLDPNEVTFYGHAKGVKYEPSVSLPVRRWADTQYRAALDDWPSVREQLERFAMTGSFKMLGRFRAHHYVGDWHYSGTFFWLRHAFVFARDVVSVPSFYGCVEAWPGVHFRRDETGCLFLDALRQLPYHEEFWTAVGEPAFARWEATRRQPVPPPDLATPVAFEGWAQPRLEQHPEEFAWWLDQLLAVSPRTLLTIGSMHGGVEWHVARRFRALGRDIRITAVDIEARPELLATIADASTRFGQQVDVVIGDSAAAATRAQLAPRYDAVFIDGDHGYRGARADAYFALTRSPRLIALHDIADSDWHAQARCCVSRVWSELRGHGTEERVLGDWGGIGILRP
jgi:predicted O-methyltransferase YrrM